MKKLMTIIGVVVISSSMLASCGGADVCKCLGETGYWEKNSDACVDVIKKEMGGRHPNQLENWEKTNFYNSNCIDLELYD